MIPLKYCLLSTLLLSASNTTFADARFSCNTEQLQNAEPLIENMIDRILTIAKIGQQYNVCRLPNSFNAVAIIYQKKRIIAYDSAYLNRLARQSGEMHWGKITVLAHEIGHHIYGHTDKLLTLEKLPQMQQLALKRQYELEADQFAGIVLANMGASLSSAKALIGMLKIHKKEIFSTHPDAKKRVNAVTKGWNIGCRQAGSNCNSQRYKANGKGKWRNIHSPLGRNATANYSLFMQQAETLKGATVNRNYCNLYASLAVKQTTRSQQYKCGFNVDSYNSPWSRAAAAQSNWCMQASAYATSKEAKFRETKLASCLAEKQHQSKQYPTRSPLAYKATNKATKNYNRLIQDSKKLKGQYVNRAYCNLYASVAIEQTKRNHQYHCGFNLGDTAHRWSSAFKPQSNWCMKVRSSITAAEATYREKKLLSCLP